MKLQKIKNEGFGLTETLLVLGILAGITITALLAYNSMKSDSNVNQYVSDVENRKQIIKTTDNNSISYNEDSYNDFSVNVKSGNWTNSDNDLIQSRLLSVSRKECSKIVPRLYEDFFIISVNKTLIKSNDDGSIDMTVLNSSCDNDRNDIVFNQVKKADLYKLAYLKKFDNYNIDRNTIMDFVILQKGYESNDIDTLKSCLESGTCDNSAGITDKSSDYYSRNKTTVNDVYNTFVSPSVNERYNDRHETGKKVYVYEGEEQITNDGVFRSNQEILQSGKFSMSEGKYIDYFYATDVYVYPVQDSEKKYSQTIKQGGITFQVGLYQRERTRMLEAIQVRQSCLMPDYNGSATCQESLFY